MNGMATQAQDSELQHSFGPQEIGFDYLPLELTPPDGTAVRTQPAAKVPYIDLDSNTPFELPEAPPESPSSSSRPAKHRWRVSAPTGWTVTCCTGAACTRWRIRSPPSSSSWVRAESCPGA